MLSSLEITNSKFSPSELLVTSESGEQILKTRNMDVGTQTGDAEGRWKRETEEVYPKRTLNFLLALVSVLFIILIIIGIIGLIFVL